MKRRIITILLSITLVGSMCMNVYATDSENQIEEVEQNQSMEETISTEGNDETETIGELDSIAEELGIEEESEPQVDDPGSAVQNTTCIWIGDKYFYPTPGEIEEIYPGVTYDSENNTLIFNNADISIPKVLMVNGKNAFPPFSITADGENSDLTVLIKGTNRIGYSERIDDNITIDDCMRFSKFRKVKFTGTGSLTLECQGGNIDGIKMGFCPYEARDTDGTKFEMEDCTLKIDATKTSDISFMGIRLSDDFIMKSGTLIIDGGDGNEANSFFGIGTQFSYGKRIDLLGGTININGPKGYSSAIDFPNGVLNIENMTINIDNQLCKYGHAFYGKADPEGICKESGKIYVKNSNIQYKSKDQSGYANSVVCAELEETGKLYNYVGDESADQKVNSLVEPNQFVEGKFCRYANFIISTKPLQGESGVELGDINVDGKINLTDVVMCLNHSSKKNLLNGDAFVAADINQDGVVNLTDVMRLMNYVSKKSSTL